MFETNDFAQYPCEEETCSELVLSRNSRLIRLTHFGQTREQGGEGHKQCAKHQGEEGDVRRESQPPYQHPKGDSERYKEPDCSKGTSVLP